MVLRSEVSLIAVLSLPPEHRDPVSICRAPKWHHNAIFLTNTGIHMHVPENARNISESISFLHKAWPLLTNAYF